MKKLFLITFLLSITLASKSQNIKGKVTDKNNNPVEFATVVLQTADSVYVNSTYTDSLGVFNFDSDLKFYRLIIQHLMFNIFEDIYNISDAGIIQLDENEHKLSEVVVKGERPIVSVIDGRITYDMPQLLNNKVVSNAYEALLQLPGVSERDNAVSLAGASSLSVIINGKQTTMSSQQLIDLLKNTAKERIQKAEIMYSAPPQYHVRGAAINLILANGNPEKSNLQGQINAGYDQSYHSGYSTGVSLLHNTSRLSTDFMYSLSYAKERSGFNIHSVHPLDGEVYEISQNNIGYIENPVHNIRLGNDFHLNNKNTLSLVYTAQITPWKDSYQKSKGTFSDSENLKKNEIPIQMHNVSFDFSSTFGLKLGTDYTFYKNHTTQYFTENMKSKENSFTADSKQNINRISFYADQSHNTKSEWTLNYGTKFMYASDKSKQEYHFEDKGLSASNTNSNLNEYTYNLYFGFDKSFSKKLSVSASLAGEYYKHKDFEEWSLFPTMETTYVLNPSHIFQISMSSDKVYPDYWEMINSIGYLNGYTELHGNPDLRPYKNYSLQLSYILRSKYIFTLYTNYNDDYFVQLPYQASEKLALIYKTVNFDYSQKLGLNVTAPFRIGNIIDSRVTLNGFYDKAKNSHFHDTSFTKDKFSFYTSLNNTLNISSKPNIKAELSGSYLSNTIQGPSDLSKIYKIDAGIKWIFARDKAELRLKANDVFNSWSPDKLSMRFDDKKLTLHMIPDSRHINLSFTYKFGNYKDKKGKEVDTSRFAK